MEKVSVANECLQAARDKFDEDYAGHTAKLDAMENRLTERVAKLNERKRETAEANGNPGATGDDRVEINAGGKNITATRSTLTQVKGSRFEALFSGRWDKKLQRDSIGRIFLDVDPVAFSAIVDYLNEMAISSKDNPPDPPSVDYHHRQALKRQVEMFGLAEKGADKGPVDDFISASNIVKSPANAGILHGWLAGILGGLLTRHKQKHCFRGGPRQYDTTLKLLYSSSRDGLSATQFHSKCDNNGCTLTIIETTNAHVFGGYSNVPWTSSWGYYNADKAFLFACPNSSGRPIKMALKPGKSISVFHDPGHGPSFSTESGGQGHLDLEVVRDPHENANLWQPPTDDGMNAVLNIGSNYDNMMSQFVPRGTYGIKEMEVFQVNTRLIASVSKKKTEKTKSSTKLNPTENFSIEINKAINAKQRSLIEAENRIICLEDSYQDEHNFITAFASGTSENTVTFNVSGTMMAVKRSTLQSIEDSVLAQQFDDTKWTEQGYNTPHVKKWSSTEVIAWARDTYGIPDDVVNILEDHEITGVELLALNERGLKMLGITRPGTVCVLLNEIKKIEKASCDFVTLIEHSPYCFGKILEYLRMNQLYVKGLGEKPTPPIVCDLEKKRFEKVVRYYFPGDSAKLLLG